MDQDLLKKMTMANWQLVNRLAAQRFQQQETAEEAALYVLEMLSDDNWKRLQGFSGKSKFTTYFTTVVYRLLEDYSRQRFGRISTPQWIKQLGSFWVTLYRLLCLERFPFSEAIHIAETKLSALSCATIEKMAEEILGRVVNCGESHIEQHDHHTEIPTEKTPFAVHSQAEEDLIQQVLSHIFFGEAITQQQEEALQRIFTVKVKLRPNEQLLLKLCYRDGLSQVEAGKLVGLNRFQINGRIRRTLAKIKNAFVESGLADELQLILTHKDT